MAGKAKLRDYFHIFYYISLFYVHGKKRVFEVLGALSIVTNCGLLYLSPQIRKAGMMLTDVEWLLVFVFLEHVLLGIRYLLHITISDKPEWVRVALAKRNYESKQALKLLKMEVRIIFQFAFN